jgi:hypothetical protein
VEGSLSLVPTSDSGKKTKMPDQSKAGLPEAYWPSVRSRLHARRAEIFEAARRAPREQEAELLELAESLTIRIEAIDASFRSREAAAALARARGERVRVKLRITI